jgi:uncharacterized OB-fold protein
MMNSPVRPAITPRGEEKLYFEALARHELVYQRCDNCQRVLFPLRQVCTGCSGENLSIATAVGRGTIYSFTTQHRPSHPFFADDVPYTLVLVDLPEGIRVFANLVEAAESDIYVGASVEAVFDDCDDDLTLLRFRPASDSEERA